MKKNSFTLAEMLVAISIFIIILGIVIIRYDKARDAAKDAQRVKDLQTISEALEKYYLKNNHYPSSLDDSDFKTNFLPTVPTDPDNKDVFVYKYCVDSDGQQQYALMAKLKTKSQALETDYDQDWPPSGSGSCTLQCSEPPDDQQPSSSPPPPYTYCIKNP